MIRKYCCHFLPAVLAVSLLCGLAHASDSDFQQGIKALASNDFATALRYLEAAVTDDPDNVRYASEYRKAAIKGKEFDRSLKFFEKLKLWLCLCGQNSGCRFNHPGDLGQQCAHAVLKGS